MDNSQSKTVTFRLGFGGVITKESGDLLKDGTYRYGLNLTANQEGSISSRNGSKLLGTFVVGNSPCYVIRKLTVVAGENPLTPYNNPRYCGILTGGSRNIYRTPVVANTNAYAGFSLVASAVDPASPVANTAFPYAHWEMAEYTAGESGTAWAYFSCPNKMLKDSGALFISGSPFTTLPQWGIPPSYGPVMAVINPASVGVLDGGASASPQNSQPYDWLVTYQETASGDEGNPSQPMLVGATAAFTPVSTTYGSFPLAIHLQDAALLIWTPASLSNVGYANVYRRGGILTDGIYRRVAQLSVSGATPGPVTGISYIMFVDNIPDTTLVYSPEQLEFDNYPPVVSTVPSPLVFTISVVTSAGWATVTVSGASMAGVTPGTQVNINDPLNQESVTVQAVTGTTFTAFFEFAHPAATQANINAITGQPCHLALTVGTAVLVAGDPNNPQMLYMSKNGRPQSFPVGTDAAGAVKNLAVGSPSNGIVNFTEFRGGVVLCMNVSALFEVGIEQGYLVGPYRAADMGLVGQSAWCKTPTEVWMLCTDGVYSWDGGSFRKRSEGIDPIFHGQSYNGILPISMLPADLATARMEYYRGQIRLLFKQVDGEFHILVCEPRFNDRWILYDEIVTTPFSFAVITELYREPDTGSLIISINSTSGAANTTFALDDATVVGTYTNLFTSTELNFTSDYWSSAPSTSGAAIPWDFRLPWFDLGDPQGYKTFEEVWLDLDPQLYAPGAFPVQPNLTIELLLDYSDVPVDTFIVPVGTNGRQLLSLLPNLLSQSGVVQSYGREAKAISFHLYGSAYPVPVTFYRLIFQYEATGMLTAGGPTAWNDLGAKTDKRLYQMAVEFDTVGINQKVILDTMVGVNGNMLGPSQTFILDNPVILGANRALKVIPLADLTIAKLIRLRDVATAAVTLTPGTVNSSSSFFRIMSVTFPEMEVYPPDIVSFTPPWDGGYAYDKYLNQVDFQVNTNGVAVTVQVQADGVNVGPAFPVSGTVEARRVNITMPTGIIGKQFRVTCDPTQAAIVSGGGCFQLWSVDFKVQQADRGEVMHTFDWDSMDWPWDKYLRTVTIEWDTSASGAVTVQLDTMSGIGGQTVNSAVTTFLLSGGRGKANFPIPVDTICKMIRLHPAANTPPITYKQWKYFFDKINYPADWEPATPWQDAQSQDDKNPTWISIDADTQNVPCVVALNNENGPVMTVTHNGTVTNRKKNYPIPVDVFAKMWRLLSTPGTNGKFQLFGWNFYRWTPFEDGGPVDPPDTILWTPWTDFGYPFDKVARSITMKVDTGGVPASVQMQVDGVNVGAPFVITTTYTARDVLLATPPNLIGKLWRLLVTPGTNGKFKLWNWALDVVREPAAISFIDTLESDMGYAGWKALKDAFFDYQCISALTVTIFRDGGQQYYQFTLPAHTVRDMQYVVGFPSAVGAILSKSKKYMVQISPVIAGTPIKLYSSSRINYMAFGTDRRQAFQSFPLGTEQQLSIAATGG